MTIVPVRVGGLKRGGRGGGRMPLESLRPPEPARIFPPRRDYASLSIKDLLDARDAYHVYLSMLNNVLATAVGRYFIHQDDWYAKHPPNDPRPPHHPRVTGARTLANSVIRPWSWPAVLVFVKKWQTPSDLGNEVVPRTLYLPDGRVVPTCVIEAQPDESSPPPALGPFQTSSLLGGGYSCLREHQGEQGIGTFGCLVRKGGTYYALTNRHVSGGEGEIVRAYIRDQYEPIGKTSSFAVDRQLMSSVFSSWASAGSRTLLTLDAGLIRIDDVNDWTSQAFGIGEIGDVFDATEQSITLDLIGCPVRAFGGSTGVSEGEIRALFFRYESLAGFEYTTDVLIGPRKTASGEEHPVTHPGDSGTLWFYDPPAKDPDTEVDKDFGQAPSLAERGTRARRLRPIAMQWGGQRVLLPGRQPSAYALGTFLSTVCRSLDVEVVRNWSLGHDEYWGKIGHFTIGFKACDRVEGSLGNLMQKNQRRIGFPDKTIELGSEFRVGRAGFVPLADVPDYVWVSSRSRPNEGIQHFADIDIFDIDGGPSLLKQCVAGPANVAASKWKAYFDGFAAKGVGPEEGALPFRVWQIWEAMVDFLNDRDVIHFVAAAGVLAHYVGDASQPLHCSFLHHGVPPMKKVGSRKYPVPRDSVEFKEFKKSREAKIHGIYEETMLEIDPATALAGVDKVLGRRGGRRPNIETGHDAAVATIRVMNDAQTRLAPKTIINADDPAQGPKARAKLLWANTRIRNATIESLADSVRLLATLWSAAWEIGRGDRIAKSRLTQFKEDDLDEIYRKDRSFLPSLSLDAMAESGNFEPPA